MKKFISILLSASLLFGQTAYAVDIPFTTFAYPVTGGTVSRIEPNRWNDKGINILEFGADPTGVADSTAAIQAAIDCSFGVGTGCTGSTQGTVYCPDGLYKTTYPLFADPPGNLRGSAAAWSSGTTYAAGDKVKVNGIQFTSQQNSNTNHNPMSSIGDSFYDTAGYDQLSLWWRPSTAVPTIFNKSASFYGDPNIDSSIDGTTGCILKPTFNNTQVLWGSTGQGNTYANFSIQAPVSFFGNGCASDPAGMGLAIPGGGGGSSFNLVQNVGVSNIYHGFTVSYNAGTLGDSNTFIKPRAQNVCKGGVNFATQSFINGIYDGNFGAQIGWQATGGPTFNIYGGNWSPFEEFGRNAVNTISGTSVISVTTDGSTSTKLYSFTTNVASPGDDLQSCSVYNNPCTFNTFNIITENFGIVPLTLSAITLTPVGCRPSGGTACVSGQATFQILPIWGGTTYWTTDAVANADLQAEVQAATKLYSQQQQTAFYGCGGNVIGGYFESNTMPLKLLNANCGFGGSSTWNITNLRYNSDFSFWGTSPVNGYSGTDIAPFLTAHTFPFVQIDNRNVAIDGSAGPTNIVFDMNSTGNNLWVNHSQFFNPIIRSQKTSNSDAPCARVTYCGEWNAGTFAAFGSGAGSGLGSINVSGYGSAPFQGFYPAPYALPRLTSAQYSTVSGTLGALNSYPIINGNSIYQLINTDGTITGSHLFAKSNHNGFSWAQDLTTVNVPSAAWSYKGQTYVVYLSDGLFNKVWPGLVIGLDNGGGVVYYTTTGVYRGTCKGEALACGTYTGYITVDAALTGTKTVVYTGTTIKQNAYSWTLTP